MISFFNHIF